MKKAVGLRKTEKEEQIKSKINRRKKKRIQAESTEIENKKTIEKNQQNKNINKISKSTISLCVKYVLSQRSFEDQTL